MSKTYGELNAEKSDLLTETIVIGYREMTEVTIPLHGRVQSAIKGPDTGEVKVRKWPEVSSAKTMPIEKSKTRKWPPTQSAKQLIKEESK